MLNIAFANGQEVLLILYFSLWTSALRLRVCAFYLTNSGAPIRVHFPFGMSRKHALHTQFLCRDALWRADCCDQREV